MSHITSDVEQALNEKAEKSGVSIGVLVEVFSRGIVAWSEDTLKTPEQYAFNRVNSFIAGGLASKLDKDLNESIDISSEPINEGKRLTNKVEYQVVHKDTKKVIKKYTQRHKAMYHAKKTQMHVHTMRDAHIVHRQDHNGRQIDQHGHIVESEHYIKARKLLHDAHAESMRQHAGRERDPELRRIDLHLSKRHSHASRVLDILAARASKK